MSAAWPGRTRSVARRLSRRTLLCSLPLAVVLLLPDISNSFLDVLLLATNNYLLSGVKISEFSTCRLYKIKAW